MKVLTLFIVATSFFQVSCNSKPERPAPILTSEQIAAADAAERQNSNALTGTVQHYYCPNSCEGSGGDSAGTCPVCGTTYEHNQAWHNQQNSVSTTSTTSDGDGSNIGVTVPSQATPEPPQNAAGVWHYICPNGHAGGAGSGVPCPECGTTLVHNTAYHN